MPQEVTVRISVQPEGSEAAGERQTLASESSQLARPMELEQLRLSSAGDAPPPLGLDELAALSSTSQTRGTDEATPPPPLELEALEGSRVGAAPIPQALEALAAPGGGIPEPMSLQELEQLGTAEGSAGQPESRRPSRRRR